MRVESYLQAFYNYLCLLFINKQKPKQLNIYSKKFCYGNIETLEILWPKPKSHFKAVWL